MVVLCWRDGMWWWAGDGGLEWWWWGWRGGCGGVSAGWRVGGGRAHFGMIGRKRGR